MPLGPVFERELTVTARRGRSYGLRVAHGLGLLAVVVATGRGDPAGALDLGTVAGVALAARLFQNLLLVQGLAIVLLTPVLVAGAIAGENQRRTLHELLTSDLNACEIVVGKLAARLSHVAVLAATGLPLLLTTGLLGGIDPPLVFAALAATLSTSVFLGGLSILASTRTRSVRGAMNLTFMLTLAWLILPGAIDVLVPRGGPACRALYEWLGPVNAWVAATSPFALWVDASRGAVVGAAALGTRVVWMIVLQGFSGALLAGLAVAGLRPSFRARLDGRRKARSRRRTALPRPPCGDDPMLWKELLPGTTAYDRPLGLAAALVLAGLLLWLTTSLAVPALGEVLASGYGLAPAGSARATFHGYLRIVATSVALVYLLGVASDAAASLTWEREKETWISLIATPLTGTEILRAKMLGAIWTLRHTAVVLVVLWLVGVAAGSVHPLGVLAVLAELAAFTWFAAALGTWISLRAEHTMQALARVMACLLLLNAGPFLIALPLLSLRPLILTGSAPLLLAASLVSHGEVQGIPAAGAFGLVPDAMAARFWLGRGPELALTCLLSVTGALLAARALTRSACRGFDAWIDRPGASTAPEHVPGARVSLAGHGRTGPVEPRRAATSRRAGGPSSARSSSRSMVTPG
jgi:ABC-type transport system involved in multi-copper enzyme maturation permease subunit